MNTHCAYARMCDDGLHLDMVYSPHKRARNAIEALASVMHYGKRKRL